MEYGFTPWVKKEVYLPNNDVLKENVHSPFFLWWVKNFLNPLWPWNSFVIQNWACGKDGITSQMVFLRLSGVLGLPWIFVRRIWSHTAEYQQFPSEGVTKLFTRGSLWTLMCSSNTSKVWASLCPEAGPGPKSFFTVLLFTSLRGFLISTWACVGPLKRPLLLPKPSNFLKAFSASKGVVFFLISTIFQALVGRGLRLVILQGRVNLKLIYPDYLLQ